MTPSDIALLQGLFWVVFGGCLLALFAYDFFHFLLDMLPDMLRVSFFWLLGLFTKRGQKL